MSKEMRQHIDNFNKFRLSENLNISDVSDSFYFENIYKDSDGLRLITNNKYKTLEDAKSGIDVGGDDYIETVCIVKNYH